MDEVLQKEKIKQIKESSAKRNDWDMFAEQDIDSNFDVSKHLDLLLFSSFIN